MYMSTVLKVSNPAGKWGNSSCIPLPLWRGVGLQKVEVNGKPIGQDDIGEQLGKQGARAPGETSHLAEGSVLSENGPRERPGEARPQVGRLNCALWASQPAMMSATQNCCRPLLCPWEGAEEPVY